MKNLLQIQGNVNSKINVARDLLLSASGKKTINCFSKEYGISAQILLRQLDKISSDNNDLVAIYKKYKHLLSNKKIALIIDSTKINKLYFYSSEYVCKDYDSSSKKVVNCLNAVIGCLTDGDMVIPLESELIIPKKLHFGEHLSQIKIAKLMIDSAIRSDYQSLIFFWQMLHFLVKK